MAPAVGLRRRGSEEVGGRRGLAAGSGQQMHCRETTDTLCYATLYLGGEKNNGGSQERATIVYREVLRRWGAGCIRHVVWHRVTIVRTMTSNPVGGPRGRILARRQLPTASATDQQQRALRVTKGPPLDTATRASLHHSSRHRRPSASTTGSAAACALPCVVTGCQCQRRSLSACPMTPLGQDTPCARPTRDHLPPLE